MHKYINSRIIKKEKEIFFKDLIQNEYLYIFKDKHNNIIINNIKDANFIICAHYDTKVNSYSEIIINKLNNNYLYLKPNSRSVSIFVILLSIIFILLFLLGLLFLSTYPYSIYVVFVTLFIAIFVPFIKNPNNMNDNTSGVEIVLRFTNYKSASIVLFDKEELGLLGSKKFVKTNRDVLKNKLIINLDTVGSGEYIVLSAFNQMERIANLLANNKKYPNIILASDNIKRKGDHWSFREYNCIGISRADKDSKGRLYAKNIHTKYDDENNISQEKLDEVEELVKDIIELWSEFE